MNLISDQLIIFIKENHLIIIPLLTVLSATFALLAWNQMKQGWKFFFSKRKLIAKLREKDI
tara:strand:- start:410 stop:592 length:183 start_codon:yes stop_codon:yes gene_type:complete